jgi:dTDP-4-amino-4,6-dideoxygalactose transaminase
MHTIVFHDLRPQYAPLEDELQHCLSRMIHSGCFILGNEVASFEKEFADSCGSSYAIGVASGTDALTLALLACGIKPGDEVITVGNTAVATIAAIELAQAKPILVDIDPLRFTLNPQLLPLCLTSNTRAIVPVHLYGCPAEMQSIVSFAKEHSLIVVEDCAQAFSAKYQGKTVGTFGDAAAFSFYPTKILGALGDGGAVVTSRSTIAEQVRYLRQYGWSDQRVSLQKGRNSRLDELQASFLRIALRHVEEWNAERLRLATLYTTLLQDLPIRLPITPDACVHVFHRYVIRHPLRNQLKQFLSARGIETQVQYPIPIHKQPAYTEFAPHAGLLSETEKAASEILSLPLYPGMAEEDIVSVAFSIKEFFISHHP